MIESTCPQCEAPLVSSDFEGERYNHLGHRIDDTRTELRTYRCGRRERDVQWGYGERWGRNLTVERPCRNNPEFPAFEAMFPTKRGEYTPRADGGWFCWDGFTRVRSREGLVGLQSKIKAIALTLADFACNVDDWGSRPRFYALEPGMEPDIGHTRLSEWLSGVGVKHDV